jgi:hypothetical protein
LVAYKKEEREQKLQTPIGEVNYIDYKKEYIPFDDMFFPFLLKKLSIMSVKSA